ncbi:MAG: hypothetical protein ACXW52_24155 [Candidatus Binatia bacterium]
MSRTLVIQQMLPLLLASTFASLVSIEAQVFLNRPPASATMFVEKQARRAQRA